MEPSARDRSTRESSLIRASDRVRAFEGLAAPDGADGGSLRTAVLAALTALDDALSILANPIEADRVGCRDCTLGVIPDATLCLLCRRKLEAASASRQP
jgi:hypothetical protein